MSCNETHFLFKYHIDKARKYKKDQLTYCELDEHDAYQLNFISNTVTTVTVVLPRGPRFISKTFLYYLNTSCLIWYKSASGFRGVYGGITVGNTLSQKK